MKKIYGMNIEAFISKQLTEFSQAVWDKDIPEKYRKIHFQYCLEGLAGRLEDVSRAWDSYLESEKSNLKG